jgi:aquaporin Z
MKKAVAEVLGTFWLVFAGCGSVVLWADKGSGVGMLGVALAFGLAVVTMAYAVGHISGGHFNPAVTIGLTAAGRFPVRELPLYLVSQFAGGIVAAVALYFIAKSRFHAAPASIGANGYTGHLVAAFITEVLLTFIFLMVILGATSRRSAPAMAGLAIGLCLALIHIVGINITGVSVNPARSLGPALFSGDKAIKELWLFMIAPPIGAALAGLAHKTLGLDSD